MKRSCVFAMVIAVWSCSVCCVQFGCASAERKVRVLDVNDGRVKEIENANRGLSREIAECSPDRLGHTFSTLQNVLSFDKVKNRSTIRVYDSKATLQCTSFVPFPDGMHLSPSEFSVCSGKIVFWNCRFNVDGWCCTNELCIATLRDKSSARITQRIVMPPGSCSVIDWDESFMWSSSTSIVVNVTYADEEHSTKRIAIIDAAVGNFRFLPFAIRSGGSLLSSFQGSFSRRYFSAITSNGEVIVCDGQGRVCNTICAEELRGFGLGGESLTMNWDDGDVLWLFNRNGRYVGINVETDSIAGRGCVDLGHGEKLMGLVQGCRAVVMHRRASDIVRSIWGNRFYIKDAESGNCVAEFPDFISRYTYLGHGLILLEDL